MVGRNTVWMAMSAASVVGLLMAAGGCSPGHVTKCFAPSQIHGSATPFDDAGIR
jgi:hypothetical protein